MRRQFPALIFMTVISTSVNVTNQLEHVRASADLLLGLLHVRRTHEAIATACRYATVIRRHQDTRLPKRCRPWLARLRKHDADVLADLLAVL